MRQFKERFFKPPSDSFFIFGPRGTGSKRRVNEWMSEWGSEWGSNLELWIVNQLIHNSRFDPATVTLPLLINIFWTYSQKSKIYWNFLIKI